MITTRINMLNNVERETLVIDLYYHQRKRISFRDITAILKKKEAAVNDIGCGNLANPKQSRIFQKKNNFHISYNYYQALCNHIQFCLQNMSSQGLVRPSLIKLQKTLDNDFVMSCANHICQECGNDHYRCRDSQNHLPTVLMRLMAILLLDIQAKNHLLYTPSNMQLSKISQISNIIKYYQIQRKSRISKMYNI